MGLQLGLGFTALRASGGGPAHPPVIVGNSDTIVSGGVTITLSAACDYGYDQLGRAFIVTPPGGVNVTARSPAATTAEGSAVNGTMLNPMRADAHGYDGRLTDYDAGLNESYPIAVVRGDILVCAIREATALATLRRGAVASYNPFYFVQTGWGENAIAPSPTGWTGRGTPAPYYVDCEAIVAAFPARDITGMSAPTLADVQAKVQRTEIALGMTYGTSATGGYQGLTTRQAAFGTDDNYGEYLAVPVGAAGLYLMSDEMTDEEKATMLAWLISTGINTYDPAVGEGDVLGPDGGQYQFHQIPVALALQYTERSSALATLIDTMPGNCLGQPFIYTSDQITQLAGHSDLNDACVGRWREVLSVTGDDITWETDRTGNIGDLAQMDPTQMYLVRQSDGAFALITAVDSTQVDPNTTGNQIGTIDDQPVSPFIAGDMVRFVLPEPVLEGDPDVRIRDADYAINPGSNATYRLGNYWGDEVLTLKGLGIWHSSFEPMKLYVARANRTDDPSAARDYPTHNQTTFVQNFWAAYADEILTGAPVFLSRPTISGTAAVGETLTATSGSLAGDATISSTWAWYLDGVVISGETGTTYLVDAGDEGGQISARQTATNSAGTQSLYSNETVAVTAPSSLNAVRFDGTNDLLHVTGMSAPAASKLGSALFTLRKSTTWPNDQRFMRGGGGGINRFEVIGSRNDSGGSTTQGILNIFLRDTGGSFIGIITTVNNTFAVDTWYSVAMAWDTDGATYADRFQIWARPDGGSWGAVSVIGGSFLTAASSIGALPDFVIGAQASDGTQRMGEWDCSEVLVWPGVWQDLSDSAVRAAMLPTADKGSDGSAVTGTAPLVFLSGDTATWHENKGSGSDFTEVGALTDAPSVPT
jgi:hypothetical protein